MKLAPASDRFFLVLLVPCPDPLCLWLKILKTDHGRSETKTEQEEQNNNPKHHKRPKKPLAGAGGFCSCIEEGQPS
jgi:hypothetical protein